MSALRAVGESCLAVGVVIAATGALVGQQWASLSGASSVSWDGVFDTRRQRFVQFGVLDQGVSEWSGLAWRRMATGQPPFGAPVSRTSFATANDPLNGRAYVFGGRAVSTLADLWYFDGLDWTQVSASLPPARRTNAAMAYDTTRRRLVLYGGEDSNQQPLTDTWEYDGTSWLQLVTGPTWVVNTRAVYDAARGVVLVLGQRTNTWNGVSWGSPAADPTTATSRIAYDPVRQRVVLYRNDTVPELREWNGTAWTTVLQAGVPRLSTPTLWFDDTAGRIMIASTTLGGTQLKWDGVALQRSSNYAQSIGGAWFHDPVRARGVLFGGNRPLLDLDETWTWDGTTWTEMQPLTRPARRLRAASTFDSTRGVGLVYGGTSDQGPMSDLWAWNGANWAQLATNGPPPVLLSSMAFDSARGRAVLFGGIGGAGFNLQTWEWNGTAWNQVLTTGGPTFGFGTMAYDPVRARTVLYLGVLTPPETWEWDGVQWTRVLTPGVPAQQSMASAVWDPQRQRVVLVGSTTGFGVWEYNGATWTQRTGIGDYAVTGAIAAIYDTNRQALSLFDGATVQELQTTVAAVASYGTACGSPPTVLMTRAQARLGNAAFGFDVAAVPNAIAAVGLSGSQGNTQIGACTLLLGPLFDSLIGIADGRGLTRWNVPVPPSPPLLGITVYAQGGTIDAGGALLLSQGLTLVVGE